VSHGFRGHRSEDVEAGRVPPGHYVTPDWVDAAVARHYVEHGDTEMADTVPP